MTSQKLLLAIFTFITSVPLVYAAEEDFKITMSQDKSLIANSREINTAILNITRQLQALKTTITTPGLGAQTIGLRDTLARAKEAFDSKDWPIALRESSRYLSIAQRPTPSVLLTIRYIQGVANEAIGNFSTAIDFYTKYLAIITTNSELNTPEITDVFGRLVHLVTTNSNLDPRELNHFLSTIAALDYPKDKRDELGYLSALAGGKTKQNKIARDWLEEIDAKTSSPDMRARARYFNALLALSSKNWELAVHELKAVSTMADVSDEIKYNALLCLARIQVKIKKPNLALTTYSQIPESSSSHKRAVFEQIYILLDEQRADEASALAEKWLGKYRDDPDAPKLKNLEPLIALRKGDLELAKILIETNRDVLSEIRKSLKTDFETSRFTANDAERLTRLLENRVLLSPGLEVLIKSFSQLKQLKERISHITKAEVAVISILAHENLEKLKPVVINQVEQYEFLCNDLMQLAEEFINSERQRISKQLSEVDTYKLASNARQRSAIFSNYEQHRRQSERWKDWLMSAEHAERLKSLWLRLGQMTGMLSSIQSVEGDLDSELGALAQRISRTRNDIQSTLRIVTERQVKNRANHTKIFELSSIIRDFSSLVNQDRVLLESYKPSAIEIIGRLDYEDSQEGWTNWFNAINLLNSNLDALQENTKQFLVNSVSLLGSIDARNSKALRDINDLEQQTELIGGKILPKLLSEIDYSISERISRQLKWAGDLEYLRYFETTDEQLRAARKRAVELQILSDSRDDFGLRRLR